jgi:hypothetical protein
MAMVRNFDFVLGQILNYFIILCIFISIKLFDILSVSVYPLISFVSSG